jgi:hypothetical protein
MNFVDPSKHGCVKKQEDGTDVRWLACSYLGIQKIMCNDGEYHPAWYCNCEDEMCSGCIPTFAIEVKE